LSLTQKLGKRGRFAKVSNDICIAVAPGICGFSCVVKAHKQNKKLVTLKITGSECKQIQRISKSLKKITLNELFVPVTRNPVFLAAEHAGCHPSCPIPIAVLKAAEVAMEMALPREVSIKFELESKDRE